jgi:hypothetical protein
MSSLEEMSIKFEGIGHVLEDNFLNIPLHQRAYAWEDKQVIEFIQDIDISISAKTKEYFLGSIVLTKRQDLPLEVVDGQQRLATTCIGISVIRDYFFKIGDNERGQDVEREYLLKKDLRSQEIEPKLTLSNTDNDFFKKKILIRAGSKEREIKAEKESHDKIEKAYHIFEKYFKDKTKVKEAETSFLIDWLEYLKQNVKVIIVTTPSHTNAFTIFETLNDRGLELAITDLLKNYLFGLSGNRLPEVQQSWNNMLGAIETIGGETILVDYIRHYWSSRNGATREKDLYMEIKNGVQKQQDAVSFTDDLARGAVFYSLIMNPHHESWARYGGSVQDYMVTLQILRMVQIRPLLISIFLYFNDKEVRAVMPRIVSWAVRLLVSGKLGGGILDKAYSDNAKKIADGEIKTTKQLFDSIKPNIPSDKEFEIAFSTSTISNSQIARYYLRCLEQQLSGIKNPELIPNGNEEVVNLEHILPQKPDKGWESFKQDEIITYSKRIGNLTLLQAKLNSDIGNHAFGEKKLIYSRSQYILTKGICDYEEWTIANIEKRQKALSALAVKTWQL